MIIRCLTYRPYAVPFVSPFYTAAATWHMRQGVLVWIETSEGIVGCGEVAPLPVPGRDVQADTLSYLARLATDVEEGRDIADPLVFFSGPDDDPVWQAVCCGLDVAWCDALAQQAGQPLARWLDARAVPSVPVNATIGAAEIDAAVQAALTARDAGYRCIKVKMGLAATPAAEIERVAAIRAAIGPHIDLRLDANGAWTVSHALAILRDLVQLDIDYVEQPVPANDIEGLATLRASSPIAIAADESVTTRGTAREIIHRAAADVLIVKPMTVGGLRSAQQVIEQAHRANICVVVTTALETGIGTLGTWHLAATLGADPPPCGLATANLLTSTLLIEPGTLAIDGGVARIPRHVGLGTTVNLLAMERFSSSL